jgi:accessory colonization factor AcfC
LVQGKVDVAIGWSAFQHLAPSGIQVVPIAGNPTSIERETTASLRRGAPEAEGAIRFLEFLRNGGADDLLARDGWILPESREGAP